MSVIYIYVLDTLADWEIGHVISELNSGRFFKKEAEQVSIKYVGYAKLPIKTMGGLTIVPDCEIEEVEMKESSILILPGADTWNDCKHTAIIDKAKQLLGIGATVCAICGATTALAKSGILDDRPHTSNGAGFLEMFVPEYHGQSYYVDCLSAADDNLITAGATGTLLWTKQIIERMNVFEKEALDAWYEYFRTGESQYFFKLMQAVGQ